jgi:uncharacterized protein YkwD
MKTKSFLLIILTALIFAACENTNQDYNPEFLDQQLILDMVNQKRTDGCNCGTTAYPPVGEVTWNDTLDFVAKNYSIKMKQYDFIDYTCKDAQEIGTKLTEQNYTYTSYGVTLAENYLKEKNLIDYWFGSHLFCPKLMNGDYKEIGVAISGPYATMILSAH